MLLSSYFFLATHCGGRRCALVLFSSQYLSGTMHESRAHIHAPYEGSRGIDIHPVDYQVRQCKTSADRGEDALADLEVDAKAPLQVVAEL